MRLVALVGFKGSGKDTAALALIEDGFVPFSFADALKDALAAVFCWPRSLLEGDSAESRAWRETTDPWWSAKLGIPNFSPRRALQLVGTEAMRQHFNTNIWTLNVERRIDMLPPGSKVVLRDGRFPNEIKLARERGGKVWRVQRGDEPNWLPIAYEALAGRYDAQREMERLGVHLSEYAWLGETLDDVLRNDADVAALHTSVRSKMVH